MYDNSGYLQRPLGYVALGWDVVWTILAGGFQVLGARLTFLDKFDFSLLYIRREISRSPQDTFLVLFQPVESFLRLSCSLEI
jgi:hypothetical protein